MREEGWKEGAGTLWELHYASAVVYMESSLQSLRKKASRFSSRQDAEIDYSDFFLT